MQEIIVDLRVAQLLHTRKGRLAKMVSEIDQGAFLAWIMMAPSDSVNRVR